MTPGIVQRFADRLPRQTTNISMREEYDNHYCGDVIALVAYWSDPKFVKLSGDLQSAVACRKPNCHSLDHLSHTYQ